MRSDEEESKDLRSLCSLYLGLWDSTKSFTNTVSKYGVVDGLETFLIACFSQYYSFVVVV